MWDQLDHKIPDFLINPRFRVCRHLVLQTLLILITVNVFWDEPHALISGRLNTWFGYFLLVNAMVYINIYILVPRFLLKDQFISYVLAALTLIFFSLISIGFLQTFLDADPVNQSPKSTMMIVLALVSSLLGFSLLIAGISGFLFFRFRILQFMRIGELESATLESELVFLKNQINPHFLFNMLNNANIMIYEDADVASRILTKLNDLLKYQIMDSAKEKVRLKDEIEFLRDFLELEKLRRDQFEYAITEEGELDPIVIPPLLFIPFVENAVKHSSDSSHLSSVYIHILKEGTSLYFRCKNSKPSKSNDKKTGGIGLSNIRRRLDLLFGTRSSLEIKDEELSYTVHLKLEL